jgi:hypothetical protein
MQGETQLGTLVVDDMDMPWFYCDFVPEAAFEAVRPLFEREIAIIEAETGDVEVDQDPWILAWQDIEALGLSLIRDKGEPIDRLLLHINGNRAWFRY